MVSERPEEDEPPQKPNIPSAKMPQLKVEENIDYSKEGLEGFY